MSLDCRVFACDQIITTEITSLNRGAIVRRRGWHRMVHRERSECVFCTRKVCTEKAQSTKHRMVPNGMSNRSKVPCRPLPPVLTQLSRLAANRVQTLNSGVNLTTDGIFAGKTKVGECCVSVWAWNVT